MTVPNASVGVKFESIYDFEWETDGYDFAPFCSCFSWLVTESH